MRLLFIIFSFIHALSHAQDVQLISEKVNKDKDSLLHLIEKKGFGAFEIQLAFHEANVFTTRIDDIEDAVVYDDHFLYQVIDSLKKEPTSTKVIEQLVNYYQYYGANHLAIKYYEKAYKNQTINDSPSYFLSRMHYKINLGKDYYYDLMQIERLLATPDTTIDVDDFAHLFTFFVSARQNYKILEEQAYAILDNGNKNPEIPYFYLLMTRFYKRSQTASKNDTVFKIMEDETLDKYARKYKSNSILQNFRMLSSFYAFFLKLKHFDIDNTGIIMKYSKEELKKIAELKQWLQKSLSKKTIHEFTFHEFMGYAFFYENNTIRAIEHFEKALQVLPKTKHRSEYLINTVSMLELLYSFTGNIEKLSDLITLRAYLTNFNAEYIANDYLKLAQSYYFKEDFENAINFCEKAYNIDPTNTKTNQLFAQILFETGYHPEASYHAIRAYNFSDSPRQNYKSALQVSIYYMISNSSIDAAETLKVTMEHASTEQETETCKKLLQKYFK